MIWACCGPLFRLYNVLFTMLSIEASEVALNLTRHVFAYFDLPYLLQSDNGQEKSWWKDGQEVAK